MVLSFILLFQDIAVIPFTCRIAIFVGRAEQNYDWFILPKSSVFLLAWYLSVGLWVRPFFKFVASSNATELLTATALFIVLGVAIDELYIGLSMALWAF